MRGSRYLLPGMLLLLVACGGSDTPAAQPVNTSSVAAVTPTPYNLDFTGGYLGFVSPDQLGVEREFPLELNAFASPLEPVRATDIASDFLKDTRILIGTDVLLDLCDDGSGFTQLFSGVQAFVQQSFTWVISPNLAGEWNQPRIVIEFDDPALDLPGFNLELIVQAPVDGVMPSWFPSGAGDFTQVFDNPVCGG